MDTLNGDVNTNNFVFRVTDTHLFSDVMSYNDTQYILQTTETDHTLHRNIVFKKKLKKGCL